MTVNNKNILDIFFESRYSIQDRYLASRYHHNDRLIYDCNLIKKFINCQSNVLDLGCGTGLIEEQISSNVKHITAIDKYPGFLSTAYSNTNISYITADVSTYYDDCMYDLIICFGVVFYLSDRELQSMLIHCHKMLSPCGKLIIKAQWGIFHDVTINKYSKELNSNYYAKYRHLDATISLFNDYGFFAESVELYPTEYNRWPDTIERALICSPYF